MEKGTESVFLTDREVVRVPWGLRVVAHPHLGLLARPHGPTEQDGAPDDDLASCKATMRPLRGVPGAAAGLSPCGRALFFSVWPK